MDFVLNILMWPHLDIASVIGTVLAHLPISLYHGLLNILMRPQLDIAPVIATLLTLLPILSDNAPIVGAPMSMPSMYALLAIDR